MSNCCCKETNGTPQKLEFHIGDYLKIFISWMFAFKTTFIVKPVF